LDNIENCIDDQRAESLLGRHPYFGKRQLRILTVTNEHPSRAALVVVQVPEDRKVMENKLKLAIEASSTGGGLSFEEQKRFEYHLTPECLTTVLPKQVVDIPVPRRGETSIVAAVTVLFKEVVTDVHYFLVSSTPSIPVKKVKYTITRDDLKRYPVTLKVVLKPENGLFKICSM
jgi:hypothetical protein